jgi:ABC-type branched-subunit amino acid transport system substrate-binding protein
MKKQVLARLLAVVLVFSMLLALTACGGSKTDNEDSGKAPVSEAPEKEAPDQEVQEPNGEPKRDTLKIGALLHQTGWFATVDMTNYYEFNAMIDYINNELGGWQIGDTIYTLEAVHADGQSDPEALRTAALSLVDAGVKFVVETNDFWVISCEDIFEDYGVMHASAYCTLVPEYMGSQNPLAFTGSNGTVGDYGTAFAVISEYYPEVKSVVMVENDNGLADQAMEVLKSYGEMYGIEVLDQNIIYPGDTTDFSSVALQIMESGADCFLGNGTPSAYGAILKEVRANGSDVVCACIQGKPATMLMEYAGPDASYNAFTLGLSTRESDRSMNTDVLNGVVDKVRELYGQETASNFDGAACNTLYIMLQAMQKAGSTDPYEVVKAWESMETVETIYGTGVAGGEKTYGIANHAFGSPAPSPYWTLKRKTAGTLPAGLI